MIRRLPRDVVDRIAAGEVVERPAAVVKELVENALDARATRIDVRIEDGGLAGLRVSDNGCGMSREDLALAFASHATSKLVDVDDLFHIVSLGFRGEALSSIGAVSHARLTTAAGDDGEGLRLTCQAGQMGAIEPAACPRGTTVEVRDLFFNTPARRRFLGARSTEAARCREVCSSLSLVNPGVRFRVEVDGKPRFSSDGAQGLRDRIAAVYDVDFSRQLVPVAAHEEGHRVEGFVTLPAAARPRSRAQHVFVNGRPIQDRGLVSAVRVAFKDFLPPSLQPSWVLCLTVDPQRLDVNVHPTKSEVRFRDREAVFRLVRRACRDALLAADLAPRVRAEQVTAAPWSPPAPQPSSAWPRAGAPGQPVLRVAESLLPTDVRPAARFLQVLDTYLVHDSPEGLVIVDQHALHERVLYARLQQQLEQGRIPRQRLLVPEPVRLEPGLADRALHMQADLERMGLELELFGPDTLAARAIPAVLRQESIEDLVRALLDPPDVHGGIPTGLDRRLFTMACHAAVKAGDSMKEDEIAELLRLGAELEHDATCPHGRPTRLLVGPDELERLFKRSGF